MIKKKEGYISESNNAETQFIGTLLIRNENQKNNLISREKMSFKWLKYFQRQKKERFFMFLYINTILVNFIFALLLMRKLLKNILK